MVEKSGLKTEWRKLPEQTKALFPEINENTSFDNVEIGKKILHIVHAHNLLCVGLSLQQNGLLHFDELTSEEPSVVREYLP
jgi:hypothetical protein